MERIIGLLVMAFVPIGCATTHVDGAPLTEAYRQVRSGRERSVEVGRYVICRTANGLEVASKTGVQWADKVSDREVEEAARDLIRHDRELSGAHIEVAVDKGEILLTGEVGSDKVAVRAAREVVDIPGASAVNVALWSPESPGPIARSRDHHNLWCSW